MESGDEARIVAESYPCGEAACAVPRSGGSAIGIVRATTIAVRQRRL